MTSRPGKSSSRNAVGLRIAALLLRLVGFAEANPRGIPRGLNPPLHLPGEKVKPATRRFGSPFLESVPRREGLITFKPGYAAGRIGKCW